MRWFAAAYAGVLALLAGLVVAGGMLLYRSYGPDSPAEAAADAHAYNFITWEVEHFPGKWIYKVRHLFEDRRAADEERALGRYFNLTAEASRLQDSPGADAQRLNAIERERAGLEAEVEDIIEGRITSVLEDQDLAMELPLFPELGLIFPPVDFELDAPPRVLAVSPRDRIALEHSYLLEPGLDRQDFEAIEQKAESENVGESGISALVVGTGGVATYPAVVSSTAAYEHVVETAFHEWVHQYLAFFPLGRSYFAGGDTRTLNETAANVAGAALAGLYFQRFPKQEAEAAATPSPTPAPAFDFTAEMRDLRRQVEDMLARGQIAAAEALMERKQKEFASHGYYIRKLNQAYFAFHGSYADTPGSIDPIGPKMQELLRKAGSPGAFLRLAAGVTSRADLDRVLAEVGD